MKLKLESENVFVISCETKLLFSLDPREGAETVKSSVDIARLDWTKWFISLIEEESVVQVLGLTVTS